MDSFDRKIKSILKAQSRTELSCPDEMELAGFLEGNLDSEREAEIRSHLGQCSKCLELVSISLELEDETLIRAPEKGLARAKAVFKPSLSRRVSNLVSEFFPQKVDKKSAKLIPLFAIRGSARAARYEAQEYVKEIGPYTAEVTVQKADDKYQVLVRLYDRTTRKTVSGIRASIVDRDKELESLVIEKGRAVFEPVPAGEHLLSFSQRGVFLGGIWIRMKGEEK